MGALGPMGDAPGIHHVPEQAEIDQIELHHLSFAVGEAFLE